MNEPTGMPPAGDPVSGAQQPSTPTDPPLEPPEQKQAAGSATIQFDDFLKLDLRVATVESAEPHPNADKLLVLKVNLGDEQRQIIAGIRAHYDPEALVGMQIVVVANLAPRKMRGLESQGMLLAASSGDDVIVLTVDKPCTPGASVS